MAKIYDSDNVVPYKSTEIKPETSKAEIDGLLARWGIKDSGWRWDMANNDVFVTFQIHETINGKQVAPVVVIQPPRIWKKTRDRKEMINWTISMRVMYWYVKSHLEMAYLMQSSKTTEFLPYIQVQMPSGETKSLGELMVPNVDKASLMARALPILEAEANR